MSETPKPAATVLLTGATGFVGKVVLEELLRRADELAIARIYVLIRPGKRGQNPEERFQSEIKHSPCFAKTPVERWDLVRAVGGELSLPKCSLSAGDDARLTETLTHIVHCAASVEFDLPIKDAAKANIASSLNVLDLAKRCGRLARMVSVSTAYVSPHPGDAVAVEEKLAPLPAPAEQIYRDIQEGRAHAGKLLKQTGLPNTYTFTKCVAEHLLVQNRGSVPLTIVRPSIVSACWRYPSPGWIDSKAAFAGFVALIGSGYLRAVIANDPTLLDIVPCDEVSRRVIDGAFYPPENAKDEVVIRYAVAGKAQSCSIRTCIDQIQGFYRKYNVGRRPDLNYNGARTATFRMKDWYYHKVPLRLTAAFFALTGKTKQSQRTLWLLSRLNYLNTAFPYFTFNTFDFKPTQAITDPAFVKEEYITTVCRGAYRHLMGRDDREVLLAGHKDKKKGSDLMWAASRSRGNWAVRLSAYVVRKALRRFVESVTFDQASLEIAQASIPKGALPVLVPTHRSYLDFVLVSYLFFAKPELGIAIPHIAAAEEFSKIPILGWLFKQTQAFYVKRGMGKEDPKVTEKVRALVASGKTLEFFIEGTRSRSRQVLPPKRGMLKCLQSSGVTCTILPMTLTYDRLGEERSFLKELKSYPKGPMNLKELFRWLGRMRRGEIHLGRIHLACGRPLALNHGTNLQGLSLEIAGELQRGQATTTHHLRSFLDKNPALNLDLEWLVQAITSRGGRVLVSPLAAEKKLDPILEKCMRYQWMHHFYPEALAAYQHNPAISHHIRRNGWAAGLRPQRAADLSDPKIETLLKGLFEPVAKDYLAVADSLGTLRLPLVAPTTREILNANPESFLPNIQEAVGDLVERQILVASPGRSAFAWGPQANQLDAYRAACGGKATLQATGS